MLWEKGYSTRVHVSERREEEAESSGGMREERGERRAERREERGDRRKQRAESREQRAEGSEVRAEGRWFGRVSHLLEQRPPGLAVGGQRPKPRFEPGSNRSPNRSPM